VGAEALGQIKPPPRVAVAALIGLMKDRSDNVRYSACESLARIGDGRALGVMLEAAKDQDSCMRGGAAEALGVFTPATDEAIKTLIGLLQDKDPAVCHTAIIALGKIGPKANGAIPELERLSEKDGDPDTREMARDACTRITSPETKPSKSQNGIFAPP
jgi:HEAT repeat protein